MAKFCGRSFRALMRRNLIYRKRRWVATIFEFLLPVLSVAIIYFIKRSVRNTAGFAAVVVPATFANDSDAIIPFSMQDYATALQAQRVCVEYDGPPQPGLPPSVACVVGGTPIADCCPVGPDPRDGVCSLLYCVNVEDFSLNDACGCGQIERACGQLGMVLGFVAGLDEICDQVGTCCDGGTVENDAFNACMATVVEEMDQALPDLSRFGDLPSLADFGDAAPAADAVSVPLSISGMADDWPVPFVFCDPRKCAAVGQNATDLCLYRVLAVASSEAGGVGAARAQKFKRYVEETYPQVAAGAALPFEHDFVRVFASNAELDAYVTATDYGGTLDGAYQPKIGIAVVFGETAGEKEYTYTLRVNSTNFNTEAQEAQPVSKTTAPTSRVFDSFVKTDGASCPGQGGRPSLGRFARSCTGLYVYNGALPIQRLVDDWIHDDTGSKVRVAENAVSFVPFPTKEYTKNGFYGAIAEFFPLLVTLGLLYPIAAGIRGIVLEKELRQKELMKMMSISESDIGWSWFLSLFMVNAITAVFCAVFTSLVYSKSSFVVLLVFWIVTFVACTCYCMVIAASSAKSTRATLMGILVFFIGYFFTLIPIAYYDTGSVQVISLLSLHPVTAFAYALIVMGFLEDAGVGLNVNTIASSDFPSGLTFSSCVSMLVLDCVLWGLASWYLNRVLRGDFGTALPFYFPFTKQYWRPTSRPEYDGVAVAEDPDVPVEQVSEQLKQQQEEGRSVHIHGLRKQFGEKTAVDGLSLSMYSGQITCLLGHNGAGKTTTIGMLTGMIPPTSGYASVAGNDIRTDLDSLRENVGICLQHDCLFPQLTVTEHVQFFSRVKGLYEKKSNEEAEKSVRAAIEDVALLEKRNTYSKDLSGGMKRKLSVAIAFCGDSNVVFLDEPTSGMDPFARRFTWNVIRQYRENRCIVLTTHFMDEADLLGDRIAIMSEGRLRCAGSSLFLKRHYGVGYQLTIIKKGGKSSGTSLEGDEEGIDHTLEKIVKEAVPSAATLSNVGTESSFQLPIGSSSEFVGMFERLDQQKESGAIETYGVSVTTLDEVFLMVARGEDGAHEKIEAAPDSGKLSSNGASRSYRLSTELNKQSTFSRHVRALFLKRATNFKRDKKAWCCSSIFPTLMVLVGFLIVAYVQPSRNGVSLSLSLDKENPDAAEERNPIIYNNPGNFKCRPGSCISSTPSFDIPETGEKYSFCGEQASVEEAICSISDSTNIIDQITQDGAFGVGEDVIDVESASLSLSESSTNYAATQYGAILFTHDATSTATLNDASSSYNDMVSEQCQQNVADDTYNSDDQLCSKYEGVGYVVNYNFTSLHSSLLYQSLADEALLRQSLGDADYKISVNVWSLPITQYEENLAAAEDAFTAWFLLVLSFPFIAGSFGTFVVAERESKAKHLQTVAGVKPTAYWISTYCWDVLNYQIPLWTVIILMHALSIESFTGKEGDVGAATIVLMVLFGPAAAGFTYIVSFLFKSPSMCNLFVIVFNFFIGMAGPVVVFILRLLGADPELSHLTTAATAVEWVLRFIPSFNLGKGLLFLINMQIFSFIEGGVVTAFSPSIARYEIIFLAWQTVFYIMIATLIDILSTKPKAVQQFRAIVDILTCKCGKTATDTVAAESIGDKDVAAENERVLSGSANGELIVLKDLTKRYRNGKLAVDHMSLAIPEGECFGLLGINGAGKTTIMGMMTAEFPPTNGDAILGSFSVSNEPEQTRRRIGYCPQFDAHFMNMTGREHVELYAAIKGVDQNVVKEAAAAKLAEVGLSVFDSNRLSAGYSGGMKRKLSVACATIGQPQIVFLDEPSTGMDPVARRDLWKVISRMVQGNGSTADEERTSVILTTHSMEECEALCPRIGIMAGGKLRCLGSAQHLKTRFGRGYQIEMKVKHAAYEDGDVQNTLTNILHFLNVEVATPEDTEGGRRLSRTNSSLMAANTNMKLEQAKQACQNLTGDNLLSEMLDPENSIGYRIYKSASSLVGIAADDLAAFCVEELRMKSLIDFFNETYSTAILRERQDNKVRFEIGSDGVTISSVFANIEENKGRLMLDDYGVSQTSLEQVFNMHAAEAEEAKKNALM